MKLATILLFFCLMPDCMATVVDDDHTTEKTHGLSEVKQEAIRFVSAQNQLHNTHYEALEPNNKIMVPRCEVPLTSEWASKSYGLSKMSVNVICTRSINGSGVTNHQWHIFVPVVVNQ